MYRSIFLIPCIFVTSFIGWNILRLICGRKGFGEMHLAEKIGLSYLFGIGAVTIQMFIMSLFGFGFTRFNVLIPWAFVIVTNLVLARQGSYGDRSLIRRAQVSHGWGIVSGRALSPFELGLISLITLQTLYNFFRALLKPLEAYDSVAIYGIKSKFIYLAGGIGKDFFEKLATYFYGAHPDYPLLIPLSETWVYTFLGRFDDILVKAIFPLFFLSFVFVFYAVVKKVTKDSFLSLLFTFALVSIKQFSDYSTIGVADLALGAYFSISLIYLYLWFRDNPVHSSGRGRHLFNISLFSSILCLWTKNEGTLLAVITLSILFLRMLMNAKTYKRKEILRPLVYASLVSAFILSWNMFKNSHGLVNENFNPSMVNVRNLITGLDRIPVIMYEYQKHIFGFKKWNIIWVLFFFILLKNFRIVFTKDIGYITITFFLFVLGYTLMYVFSAVSIDFLVRTTWSRCLLHILPVCIFWMAVIFHETIVNSKFKI